ncbi:hypothetical protein [Fortiea contorta]|uniref:hypothetical protein n=1 Tax=Fortiea contorta TaxID=1892405 RepID=UPI00034C5332|nr:hypothetical protein [Fortiea contorta]
MSAQGGEVWEVWGVWGVWEVWEVWEEVEDQKRKHKLFFSPTPQLPIFQSLIKLL